MKIGLVVPPWETNDSLTAALYPLPYAAAVLGAQLSSHVVELLDALTFRVGNPAACAAPAVRVPGMPKYLHYGMTWEEFEQALGRKVGQWDAIGLLAGQCNLWRGAARAAGIIRRLGFPLVVGGSYATTCPTQALEAFKPDVLVIGEAEAIIAKAFSIAKASRAKAWQPVTLKGTPADINLLPLPAWNIADLNAYPRVGGRLRGVVSFSRGCPFSCAFCGVGAVHGSGRRRLTLPNMRKHLEQLHALGVRYFSFLDDCLLLNPQDVEDVLAACAGLGRNCRFYIEEGVLLRLAAQPGIMRRLECAGFERLPVGLETWNLARATQVGKPYTEADRDAFLREAASLRRTPRAFYIMGLPGDTLATVAKDLVQFGKARLAVRPNNWKALPGSKLARFANCGEWGEASWKTPQLPGGLTMKQIIELKRYVGAVGAMAEEFGIAIMGDSFEAVQAAFAARKFQLSRQELPGLLMLQGRFFRAGPYARALELLALRFCGGFPHVKRGNGILMANARASAANDVQLALSQAIRTSEKGTRKWKTS